MAQSQLPVRLFAVADLPSLGLNQNSFRFGFLTLESEKYICIREEAEGSAQVVVVELQNNNNIIRRPMKAEAAIMNPQHNIIALKAKNEGSGGHFVQVYNLDSKSKLKVHDFPEPILYWRWLSVTKLAIVTSRTVFHWNMEGSDTPLRIFDRAGPLEGSTQIINYTADNSETWCLLTGISTPDGGKTINGHMQLYFTGGQQQQILEGHAGCFGEIPLKDGQAPTTCFSFIEKKTTESVSRIHVMEINKPASGQKFKATTELIYPVEAQNDFPVAMHLLSKYGVIAAITKLGYLYLFETVSANLIYRTRLSEDPIFVTARNSRMDTVMGVNRRGQVLGISLEEGNIVSFIMNNCRHIPDAITVGFSLAQRFNLPGANELFVQSFNKSLASGDIKGAAKIAAGAPSTLLRNQETIVRLRSLPQIPGQPHPMLTYFSTILEIGKLNKWEVLEIARPLLQQGRKQILEGWVREDKVECSEELGDLVREFDPHLALQVNMKINNPQKVLVGLMETGQYEKVKQYCAQNGISPDYMTIIRQLAATNIDSALVLAKQAGKNVDINAVADIFLYQHNLQAATAYLLEVLKDNLPEQGHLQTKLLELNIVQAPQVAETIFQTDMFSHYDKIKIAQLCEQAEMFQRAIENYSNINDIRRVLVRGRGFSPEFLVSFFGHMTPNNALQCLYDMMKANRSANLQVVVQTAIKYYSEITIPALVEMFEKFGSYDGLFYFLGSVLSFTEDPDVYYKYIEAAAKLNQSAEVERVIRETKFYDPVRVKDFLKEIRLPDPRALIYLCDIHGFTEELTRYLYKSNLNRYIEVYLVKLNPKAAPSVLGTLLELDTDETYVKQILNTIRAACPAEALIDEMEKRNRLRVIQSWLEDREREGIVDSPIHTALAKIYIDTNRDPEDFLIRNEFYDPKIVGKYCEERNPELAVKAYTRAWGQCDDELIDLTTRNGMYRVQARYLVERKSPELWAKVLSSENDSRRAVIDQVVAFALPESREVEEVSVTVKAFLKAELQKELIELLEKIVLHKSDFSKNKNLQNMLIVTAIKADPARVVDYINRLDNYDAPEIAQYALTQHNLAEEAFLIYRKAGMHEEAIDVLLNNLQNIDRAGEFAERVGSPEVWSRLGRALLDYERAEESIEAFIKAKDASFYREVIQAAEKAKCYSKLIKFLMLARVQQLHQKDSLVDSELIFCLAKCDMLAELEEFISGSNQADIGKVGDRCFDEKIYEAARILFASINNWAKLASCYLKLKKFMEAMEAAKQANTPRVWKDVTFACVENKEFKLAIIAGLNIITHPDHLEDIIRHYEHYGYPDELINLLENGLPSERAHQGIFTELGSLYAKYKPKRLMEHCKNYYQKINIPKLIRSCERFRRWSEAVFLYMKYDEFDNALVTMIEHSYKAWNHTIFTDVIQKATNQDFFFRAIIFYIEEQPMLLNDLLKSISAKIDHAKAVQVLRRAGHLALALPWLQTVQIYNVSQVNEAVNELLIELEDYESLRVSVTSYDSCDQLSLAKQLEKHPLLEMRRISAYIYRVSQKYPQSIELSKADEYYQDAMETANQSKSPELVEELIRYFVEIKDKEAFCACTYICYSYLSPDVVMELSWRAGYLDFAMPFFIQSTKDMYTRLTQIEKKASAKEKKEEEKAEQQMRAPLEALDAMSMVMPGLNSMPALMPSMPMTNMNPMMTGMNPMMTGMNPMMGAMMTGMNPMMGMMTGMYDPSGAPGQFQNRFQ
jgi:clathrin heavy chain